MNHKSLEVCVCCLAFVLAANAQPPVITSQPQSILINNASTANFSVTATNAAGYQWQFDGASLTGQTNSSLLLNNVNSNQAGSYTVAVTSADGESVTNTPPATLTVVPGTIFTLAISGFAAGGPSNLVVELFDHDKPATVANFIHYVTSGAYSNMFFDRCVPGVLQGGTYDTQDRTNTSPGLQDFSLYTQYQSTGTASGVPFPQQVDSEYGEGPFIPNTLGTLAMALAANNTNSASSSFFINLADNSASLDSQDFTVFGRILSGANVLQFFNTLQTNGGGIIDYADFDTNSTIYTLPVDYLGTNEPSDANLYYADFTMPNPPEYQTNILPTVSVTLPANGQLLTNGNSIVVQGTAGTNQWTGIANVSCTLSAETGIYAGEYGTVNATGTTNWTAPFSADIGTLPPGLYDITAVSQDGYGILGESDTNDSFNILAPLIIVTNGVGTVEISPAPANVSGLYLFAGTNYTLKAVPGPGEMFYNWTGSSGETSDPSIIISGNSAQTWNVTFLATNLPGLTLTTPAPGSFDITNGLLPFAGVLPGGISVTQVTVQLFLRGESLGTPRPTSIEGTNWSVTLSNISSGSYTADVLAYATSEPLAFVSENFKVTNFVQLTLVTNGIGSITPVPSSSYVPAGTYTFKAVPGRGQKFYFWSDGVNESINPKETVTLNSPETLTATFFTNDLPHGITITTPRANEDLTNLTAVAGRIPSSLKITQMTCQLFLQSNAVTSVQPVTMTSTAWSNTVTNLAPGPYTILLLAYDEEGRSTLVSQNFNLMAKLTLATNGSGGISPDLNGKYLVVDRKYAISAKPKPGHLFAGWSAGVAEPAAASTTFIMASNTVLTATFISNYFPNVAGTYQGLFLGDTNVAPTNSGFLSVAVTGTGTFSGRLSFPSRTYPISGLKFSSSGSIGFGGLGLDGNLLYISLSIDLTNGTGTIVGSALDSSTNLGIIWSNNLVAYLIPHKLAATNSPPPGKYVLDFEPATNGPVTGDGFAAVNISRDGAVVLSGALADNTGISQSAEISRDGIWPVYIAPSSYHGKGMLIGWETNLPSGECNGQLFWIKPPGGTYFTEGFSQGLNSAGTNFLAPADGNQYQIIFGGGAFGATFQTNLLAVKSGQFRSSETTGDLDLSLSPTGVLSGHVFNQVDSKTAGFRGVFTDTSQGGAGFTLGDDGQTGYFSISLDTNAAP